MHVTSLMGVTTGRAALGETTPPNFWSGSGNHSLFSRSIVVFRTVWEGACVSPFLPPLVLKSTGPGQSLGRASAARVIARAAASSSASVTTTWSTASESQTATARKELTVLTAFRFTFPRPTGSASRTAGTSRQGERPGKGSAARRESVDLPPATRRKKTAEGTRSSRKLFAWAPPCLGRG